MTVGQQLLTPETGWRRYDDTDSRITYEGIWSTPAFGGNYNGTFHDGTGIGNKYKFKFRGTKFRLICFSRSSSANNVQIKTDSHDVVTVSFVVGNNFQTIVYEELSLSFTTHTVEVTSNSTGEFFLDAIDIDDTGELYNYDYIPKFCLLKQNGNYYTIKSTNYDAITTHNFLPLTLTGGVTPNKSDIETLGFTDLSVLTTSITVGSDTFIPVNKFDNTAELKIYKQS